MKILILSKCFFPELSPRAFRTTELAKALAAQGHEITVYFQENDYDYSDFLQKHPMKLQKYNAYRMRREFTHIGWLDRIFFRFMNQFLSYPTSFEPKYIYDAVKDESGYDLLITIAVPHSIHWAVGKLYSQGKRIARKWIADCGDPFMLAQSGKYHAMFYFKGQEKRWCRECDYITVPTEASKDGYYPEFRDKIRVIPQGFDFSEVQTSKYALHPIPTFAYSGALIPGKRDLRPVLDELIRSNAVFELHVYTKQKELFTGYREKLAGKLFLHDYIPRLELLDILSTMDFLLNLENGVAVQTPSKLIDYALTGRPILSLDSSRLDAEKLAAFLNGDYSRQYRVENLEQYDIRNVARKFLELAKK